jgi:ATP-dependent DNA helicase RecQ
MLQMKRFGTGESIHLVDAVSGEVVAALSKKGRQTWSSRTVSEIRVLAVARRTRGQSKPEYADRCRVEPWEIPVLEVVWA